MVVLAAIKGAGDARLLGIWLSSSAIVLITSGLLILPLHQMMQRLVREFQQSIQANDKIENLANNEKEKTLFYQATIQHYVDYLTSVAHGSLSERINLPEEWADSRDVLGVLGKQLNETTASIQKMIQHIQGAASNLNTASTEILAATTQQASGASQQSAAITQTTSTVEEVRTISEQFINRSQEVANTSQHSVDISRSGERVINETVASMDRIKAQVSAIAENILGLSERTQQIGDIITTVNEIASQSNILALNAAVEAARAGEHGKGFAVVAAEVRNLAEQSRQATAQVRSILLDIQKAINTTMMVTEEGTKVVDVGVTQAEQAGRVIQQLAGVIDESPLLATQMAAGGRQQATGIEQIAAAMQNIKLATIQGLAATRQTERAAQDLSQLAHTLMHTLAQYH
jgi:methyl-accepting chemotaxis protein